MPIGEDIKDVLNELGTPLVIYKWPGPTKIEENMDHEFYPTHSSEFLRMFFSGVTLVHDTAVVSGDVVEAMGMFFIVTNVAPSYFEGSIVDWTSVFFKVNCLGKIARYAQKSSWDANYSKVRLWTDIYTEVRALQYESNADQKQYIEKEVVAMTLEGNILYLPSYVTVEEGDRWYPNHLNLTEFYRIASIDIYRMKGLSVCTLKDDERE